MRLQTEEAVEKAVGKLRKFKLSNCSTICKAEIRRVVLFYPSRTISNLHLLRGGLHVHPPDTRKHVTAHLFNAEEVKVAAMHVPFDPARQVESLLSNTFASDQQVRCTFKTNWPFTSTGTPSTKSCRSKTWRINISPSNQHVAYPYENFNRRPRPGFKCQNRKLVILRAVVLPTELIWDLWT